MLKGGDTRNGGLRGARRVDHLASLGEHFCLEPYEWNRGTWQGAPSSGILFCIMLHYLWQRWLIGTVTQVLIKFLIVLCVETDKRPLRDKCESGGLLMRVEDY